MKYLIYRIKVGSGFIAWFESEQSYRESFGNMANVMVTNKIYPTEKLAVRTVYKHLRKIGIKEEDILIQ